MNEFLTWMESYRGIAIYTTNRLIDLDPAALRRFNYKLEFGYLKPDGVAIFYNKILSSLVGSDLEKGLQNKLKNIECLTPGDFKIVKTKFQFKNEDEITHEALIEALKQEATIKEIHMGKKAIGF